MSIFFVKGGGKSTVNSSTLIGGRSGWWWCWFELRDGRGLLPGAVDVGSAYDEDGLEVGVGVGADFLGEVHLDVVLDGGLLCRPRADDGAPGSVAGDAARADPGARGEAFELGPDRRLEDRDDAGDGGLLAVDEVDVEGPAAQLGGGLRRRPQRSQRVRLAVVPPGLEPRRRVRDEGRLVEGHEGVVRRVGVDGELGGDRRARTVPLAPVNVAHRRPEVRPPGRRWRRHAGSPVLHLLRRRPRQRRPRRRRRHPLLRRFLLLRREG
mmetsp:Transcript_32302/g.103003  ORF Transcript_32302/g.103003 Transcript_32302/m.103003 type:complete len:266 (+) Transcript_32302:145-942(+)